MVKRVVLNETDWETVKYYAANNIKKEPHICSSLSGIKMLDTKNKLEERDIVNNLVVKDYSYDGEILT